MDQLAARAREVASAAAAAADVRVVELAGIAAARAAAALFDEVWGREPGAGSAMSPEVLRALAHAGNQVTGAYRGDRLVAATAAFLGRDATGVHLHSHITGVRADAQGRGVGWALKLHQRAWCLERGLDTVRWTFDPLVRRNAVFNLVKLGARAVAYQEDVYGRMQDARNRGLPTDRLVAEWRLGERRVVLAAEGRGAEPRLDALRTAGAAELLADHDGEPVAGPVAGRHLLVQVPADVEALRRDDRDRAERWALALRATLGAALGRGYRVTGLTRDGWYVLAAGDTVEELA